MLHVKLPLPSRLHVVVIFGKHQPSQSIFLGESLDEARAMFPCAASKVLRYADVQRAIGYCELRGCGEPKTPSEERRELLPSRDVFYPLHSPPDLL
jgi:hypothetical protein